LFLIGSRVVANISKICPISFSQSSTCVIYQKGKRIIHHTLRTSKGRLPFLVMGQSKWPTPKRKLNIGCTHIYSILTTICNVRSLQRCLYS
jgi:hypothetical protein